MSHWDRDTTEVVLWEAPLTERDEPATAREAPATARLNIQLDALGAGTGGGVLIAGEGAQTGRSEPQTARQQAKKKLFAKAKPKGQDEKDFSKNASLGRDVQNASKVMTVKNEPALVIQTSLSPFLMGDWEATSVLKWMKVKLDYVQNATGSIDRLFTINRALSSTLLEENHLAKLMNNLVETQKQIAATDTQVEMIRSSILEQEAARKEAAAGKAKYLGLKAPTEGEEEAENDAQTKLEAAIRVLRLQTVHPIVINRVSLRERREEEHHRREVKRKKRSNRAGFIWDTLLRMKFFVAGESTETAVETEQAKMDQKLEERRRDDQDAGLFKGVLLNMRYKLGNNVAQLFLLYMWIMMSNCIMMFLWSAFVIIPYIIAPPPEGHMLHVPAVSNILCNATLNANCSNISSISPNTGVSNVTADWLVEPFSWSNMVGSGILGGQDPGIESSFFYMGAYHATHYIGDYAYRMDWAYIMVLVAMFMLQVANMLRIMFSAAEEAEGLADYEGVEWSINLFGSWYFSIIDTKICNANTGRFIDNCILLIDEDTLERKAEEDTMQGCSLRILGVLSYLALFPMSYMAMYHTYENSQAVSAVASFGVPMIVTSIRILVPMYLVPMCLSIEGRPHENNFYHMVGRMFLLKMFTINALLYIFQRTSARPDGMCMEIFIGKLFWRQEVMDIMFHVGMDGFLSYQRWRLRIRPEFDWEVFSERIMEVLYRQAYIWTATPYSPMISYLGLFSTVILFYYQTFTVGISYEPPVKGWGGNMVRCMFMQAMLATFVISFIPSWTWLHSAQDCGPYAPNSPYDAIVILVAQEFPGGIQNLLKWATMPTITWSCIIVMAVASFYLARAKELTEKEEQKLSDAVVLHRYDKTQLLRSQGCKY